VEVVITLRAKLGICAGCEAFEGGGGGPVLAVLGHERRQPLLAPAAGDDEGARPMPELAPRTRTRLYWKGILTAW